MRRAAALVLAALLVLGIAPVAGAGSGSSGGTRLRPEYTAPDAPLRADGRYIVILKDGVSVTTATGRARARGVTVDRTFRHAVHGYAARLDGPELARLRADPSVAEVVPDGIIRMTGQTIPRGVKRIGGMANRTAAIDGVDDRVDADVAIVDTGIGDPKTTPPSHEDLNIAGGYNCYDPTPSDGLPPDPTAWGDPNGHGTHVAGTVGALDNDIGVVGVAPGVRLWAIRILNPAGDGLVSWYVCGLDWIAAQRDPVNPELPLIEAVNMSVAKPGTDDNNCGLTNADPMHQAICRLVASGVTVVAAAGNNSFSASKMRPASYDEVITVSALADTDGRPGGFGGNLCYSWGTYDKDDTFADFSNYGPDVDLIASGKCTYSTLPGNRYGWVSGTSMAAPHVTGAVALYKASRPDATPAQVRAALIAAGNLDWNTATDPDSRHEPMLDVSHIVARGDFAVDATPGTSRDARIAKGGGQLDLPVQVVRAEDFPGRVDLAVTAPAPLGATLAVPSLEGQDAVLTSMTVTVPPDTASGDYAIPVTATDDADPARTRSSVYSLHVDSDVPVAARPASLATSGSRLSGSSLGMRMSWPPASDPQGVTGYQVRWLVDGVADPVATVSAATLSTTRYTATGHRYQVSLRARDAAGNWSEWVTSDPFRRQNIQDDSPLVATTRPWHVSRSSAWYGGTTRYSTTAGATMKTAFTGRGIVLIAPTGSARGKATILVDGVSAGTVDFRATTPASRRIMFSRTWPASGSHTIMVKVAGTAGRPRVDVDAFIVIR